MQLDIKGKYNTAVVMTDAVEQTAVGQIITLCSQEIFKDSQIRIMADCHAGKGCVVGFTATIKDKIIPNLVGVDISCSVSAHKLDASEIDFAKLDSIIREHVPSGMSTRQNISKLIDSKLEQKIKTVCQEIDDTENFGRHMRSVGSLGGGNHFIALEKDEATNTCWLLIHCGSRNFGHKICTYHQDKAGEVHEAKMTELRAKVKDFPNSEKAAYLKSLDSYKLAPDLKYLEGSYLDKYVEHMKVAQEFATKSHEVIAHEICSRMGWKINETIFTNHNYIEFLANKEMIIRKGAVSAKKDEMLIIPLNMKDGSLICRGKGSNFWNNSAPHGAGRVLSRGAAKRELSLEEFKSSMQGIWTSCVSQSTLDEAPLAYKNADIILDAIGDTVEIVAHIVPVYNFKAV